MTRQANEPVLTEEEWEQQLHVYEERTANTSEPLGSLPVYARSYAFGLRVHEAVKPYMDADTEEKDDDMMAALMGAFTIAAKISGGHAMGYDDELICGN